MSKLTQICEIHVFERFEDTDECKGEKWDTITFDKSKPILISEGSHVFDVNYESVIPNKGILYIAHPNPDVSDGINLEYETPSIKIPNYTLGEIKPDYTSLDVKNKYDSLESEIRLLISSNDYLNGKISTTLICEKSKIDPLYHSVETQMFYLYKPTKIEIKIKIDLDKCTS